MSSVPAAGPVQEPLDVLPTRLRGERKNGGRNKTPARFHLHGERPADGLWRGAKVSPSLRGSGNGWTLGVVLTAKDPSLRVSGNGWTSAGY